MWYSKVVFTAMVVGGFGASIGASLAGDLIVSFSGALIGLVGCASLLLGSD